MNDISHPTQLDIPVILVNAPFSLNNKVKNNIWMYKDDPPIDKKIALTQFQKMVAEFSKNCVVYTLPSDLRCQDQPFVANLGVYLPSEDIIYLSNFTSEPRRDEQEIGNKFFLMMNYKVGYSHYKFEGTADLKFVRDNIYVGGFGIRTEEYFYHWLELNHDININKIKMTDDRFYHFDCSFAPITSDRAMVITHSLGKKYIKKLEKIIEIVAVPKRYIEYAWTNIFRVKNTIYYAPPKGTSDRPFREFIDKKFGLDYVPLDLTEFELSGAAASCLVMELNKAAFERK